MDRFRASTSLPLRGRSDKKKPPSLSSPPCSPPPSHHGNIGADARELDEGEGPLISRGVSLSLCVSLCLRDAQAPCANYLTPTRIIIFAFHRRWFISYRKVAFFLPPLPSLPRVRGFLVMTIVAPSFLAVGAPACVVVVVNVRNTLVRRCRRFSDAIATDPRINGAIVA